MTEQEFAVAAERSRALAPRDEADLAEILRAQRGPFEVLGGGSKRSIGRPQRGAPLELAALTGVVDYEPAELVLTARAATPLGEIERLLAERRQRLAFEPPRYAALLGSAAEPTIGGVCASNVSGSRRLAAGAARDHLLGLRAVNGRGERFAAGGRVVKNVTGYDLPKLLAGSWGTLAVLSEVTLRVVPAAETECTLVVAVRSLEEGMTVLAAALGSACEVSAAAYLPERGALLRVEGFAASVRARAERLRALLPAADVELLADEASQQLWRAVAAAEPLAEWPIVWRISVPSADAARIVAALEPERFLLDWGGGLIWAAYRTAAVETVRSAAVPGHATLIKAPPEVRATAAVFPPQPAALRAVAERVKAAFDPDGKLNPGRMD